MRVNYSILSVSTVILFLLLGILPVTGQNSLQMYVKGFEQDPTDLTPSNPNYRKKDGNGDVYAIIKVKSDAPGDDLNAYNFNFGMMSSTKEIHGDELWLYVQKNAKTVTITRPGYATIQRYDLKIAIQPACTYILTLSSHKPTVQSSILQFKVSPPDEQATVKVKREGSSDDYEIWGTVDQNGSIDNMLEEGIYLYKIVADKYFDFEGRVEIDCAEPVYVESVTLKPNFGYLEVTGTEDISGAEIYVNDKKVGEIPYKSSEHWACGDYRIAVVAELYKTYSSTFTIRSGETTVIKPQLEPNFAEITIKTADKAEIWLDGKLSGTGLWKGRLKAGLHNVECRQTSHETSKQQIIVQQGKTETFTIEAPKPITGSLYISSTPSGADIVIDGERIGQVTPYLFNNILTGNHVVTLLLNNYEKNTNNVMIKEGERESLKIDLKSSSLEPFFTDNSSKTNTLDYSNETRGGYYGYNKTFVYLQTGYQVGSCSGVPLTFGYYLAGFNMEISLFWGTSSDYIKKEIWAGNKNVSKGKYVGKTSWNLNLGYGFRLGNKLMITPQWGFGRNYIGHYDEKYDVFYTSLGARLDCYIGRHFGLFATPEYKFEIYGDGAYDKLSDVSSVIRGYGKGFDVRFGLSLILGKQDNIRLSK